MNKSKIFIIALSIFLIDQIVKTLLMNLYDVPIEIINNFFTLYLIKNTGGAFSIFNSNTFLLTIISIVFLIAIILYLFKNNIGFKESLFYSFIIGGLLGNLFDRVFRNGVIDYLSFNILGYNFPIFNIADIFITIGVILLIFMEIRNDINDRRCR